MNQASLFDNTDRVVDQRRGWAEFSDDGLCRWALGRPILPPEHASGLMLFIMLNPSTADATKDDPTVNRCRGFAMREAMCELVVCNLSAYRATKPADLWANYDLWAPTQVTNRDKIANQMAKALYVVCAWGSHGERPEFKGIKGAITDMARTYGKDLLCLGTTAGGEPRHPLYIAGDIPFQPWRPTA